MSLKSVIIGSLISILSKLPPNFIYFLGKLLGQLLNLIPNRHKKVTLINLRLAFPHLKENEILNLTKKSLIETCTTLLESGYVWKKLPGSALPKSIEIIGFDEVLNSYNQGNGLMLFTPHQANIEILINFLGRNIDCSIPYSKMKNNYLDQLVRTAREKMGVSMVDVNMSGVKNLLHSLKNGKAVAIASDQVPELSGGEISKFFGQDCLSMSLMCKLQNKTNARVHSMVCIRKNNGKGFNLFFSPQLDMPLTIKEGVEKMNMELEKCIMLAPEQYAWEYKKFRRAGYEDPYK